MTDINNLAKGVLFDLDGTLLDTADDLGQALNKVLTDYGFPTVSADEYYSQASNGANALLNLGFGESFEKFDLQELRARFLSYYEENIACKTSFFNGILSVLEHLDKNNIPWGVVTNKPEFLTTPLLASFSAFNTSKVTVCGDTLNVSKPAPEPMYLAAEALKLSPEDIIYLGDARRDIEAGNNAGMRTAAVSWGYIAQDEDIQTWDADVQFDTPAELFQHIIQPIENT